MREGTESLFGGTGGFSGLSLSGFDGKKRESGSGSTIKYRLTDQLWR